MSVVTSLVLNCSRAESYNWTEKPPGNIALINAWLRARDFQELFDCAEDKPQNSAGSKYPQYFLYLAGFNYFPENDFVEFFRTMEWEAPENVVLILKPDQGSTRVYRPAHTIWGGTPDGEEETGASESL